VKRIKLNVKQKIKYIDRISSVISFILISGMIFIVIESDFQIFMNVRLIIFAVIFSIIGLILNRKRTELFDETL
jgi:Zn-dependent membrane protease YugP|tara:strand:+ start:460 stop:681 length:222 start_codon:yes stop_codon:yes gene_type:complete